MYDVVIVGAGAAGMSAAIYTCRKKMKTLIISVDVGGQTNLTNHIENYPGVPAIPGPALMKRFEDQAKGFGAEFIGGKVLKIEKKEKTGGKPTFTLKLGSGEKVQTRTVILAFGKVARELGIPGEQKFLGRGVSTCATCDGPLFKGKKVAIVGGGNSAVEAAIDLVKIAKKVYLIHRRQEFRADEITVEKLRKTKNVELILDTVPTNVEGDKFVTGLGIEHVKTKEKRMLKVDGVFVEIGYIVDTSMVKGLVKTNTQNEIITDRGGKTSQPGIFAAGDVTDQPYKQTIISAGEGAKAALECHKWFSGTKTVGIDW